MAAEQDNDPKAKDKKEPKLEIRDLKPKKEAKGGAGEPRPSEKRPPGSTEEIDFMDWE
jgi:hypothetical protein